MATCIYMKKKRNERKSHRSQINSRLNVEKRPKKRNIKCTYVAELELFAKEWVWLWWCDGWQRPRARIVLHVRVYERETSELK